MLLYLTYILKDFTLNLLSYLIFLYFILTKDITRQEWNVRKRNDEFKKTSDLQSIIYSQPYPYAQMGR